MPRVKKQKYYGVYSKNDNFLYGVFPLSKDGHALAKKYINKIAANNKKIFYIKEN
jgi:hypothetical protein